MKKPAWVVEKERARRDDARATIWLYGLHAVRDAVLNPRRVKLRLVVTRNAADRLGSEVIEAAGIAPEIADPRDFPVPLDPGSVHQGAALETQGLEWGALDEVVMAEGDTRPLVLLLDRVTDPHNVGAILRSAEVFGARAVLAPNRHAAPESGALAKAASGALERQPYLRVGNLAEAMARLRNMGFWTVGLSGNASETLAAVMQECAARPLAIVLGAEGPGLRARTVENCDRLARIPAARGFASLNVSNAAAVALYSAVSQK
jgi:23S rRNA (guanosine2251-2'-O)-methyltransferase